MLLNEYLEFRYGAVFENKYNKLAAKEILENYENYKKISLEKETLEEMIENNSYDGYYDCDDPEMEADVKEGLELLKAFICAFVKDKKNKKIALNSIVFGKGFLKVKSIQSITKYNLNICGSKEVLFYDNGGEIYEGFLKEISQYYFSNEEKVISYRDNNEDFLKKVLEHSFGDILIQAYDSLAFEDSMLREIKDNGNTLYAYHYYVFDFGKNIIPIYTTEIGFDFFGIIRSMINDNIIDYYKDNEIVKDIFD